jgi:hypothetical protein
MTNTAVRVPRSPSGTGPVPAATPVVTWPPRTRVAEVAAAVASVLGLGSAVVSLGWGMGGTFLLDTVGGGIEQLALSRTPVALVAIVAVVALKVVAALLPGWAVSPDGSPVYPSARRRVVRALAWVEAVLLTGYGAVMTVGGVLVTTGVVEAASGADDRAIAWHAYLWDPWFGIWGLAATVALLASRRPPARTDGNRRRPGRPFTSRPPLSRPGGPGSITRTCRAPGFDPVRNGLQTRS